MAPAKRPPAATQPGGFPLLPKRQLLAVGAIVAVLSAVAATFTIVAKADTNHGRPGCTGQVDEAAFGSRDGFDHWHLSNPDVNNSLQELEAYINVCRTNDATVVEAASGSARAIRVAGVTRVQLRAQLQRYWDPPGAPGLGWHTVVQSDSVNTGDNRTLTVTTPTVDEIGSIPAHGHFWHRSVARSLTRYSNGSLVFTAQPSYAVWLGDGPVSPVVPPA
jgi:hypothetical protein